VIDPILDQVREARRCACPEGHIRLSLTWLPDVATGKKRKGGEVSLPLGVPLSQIRTFLMQQSAAAGGNDIPPTANFLRKGRAPVSSVQEATLPLEDVIIPPPAGTTQLPTLLLKPGPDRSKAEVDAARFSILDDFFLM